MPLSPIPLTPDKITLLAGILHESRIKKLPIDKITKEYPGLTIEDAYKIQAEGIKLRQEDGEKIVGYKMGLTSRAKMEQVGLKTPIYGLLTNKMQVSDPDFDLTQNIHPKIEPEIAFELKEDLYGTPNLEQCLDAIKGVGVALEILDSRFIGFKYFSLPDVIADNASSSRFFVGPLTIDPKSIDLTQIKLSIYENNALKEEALSSAILGNPLESLKECVHLLNRSNQGLPKGAIILSGAATVALELKAGITIQLKASQPFETLSLKIG